MLGPSSFAATLSRTGPAGRRRAVRRSCAVLAPESCSGADLAVLAPESCTGAVLAGLANAIASGSGGGPRDDPGFVGSGFGGASFAASDATCGTSGDANEGSGGPRDSSSGKPFRISALLGAAPGNGGGKRGGKLRGTESPLGVAASESPGRGKLGSAFSSTAKASSLVTLS